VTERLTGKFTQHPLAITPSRDWNIGAGVGPVEVFDPERIRKLLQAGGELLVLVGEADHHTTEAKKIVAALEKRGIKVMVEPASKYTAKDKLDNPMIKGQVYPFFNGVYNYAVAVNKNVILLGSPKDNLLIQRLLKNYDLGPYRFRDDDPGPERAVVWWAGAAFGLEHEIVAVLAADSRGLSKGVDVILAKD
jgi:hypothetical protein